LRKVGVKDCRHGSGCLGRWTIPYHTISSAGLTRVLCREQCARGFGTFVATEVRRLASRTLVLANMHMLCACPESCRA